MSDNKHDWAPGSRVTICSLGYVYGPLTEEAKEELQQFASHLQNHREHVEGCRFCDARARRKGMRNE